MVIVTSTTGSLGSYVLAALEAIPESKVMKIYCPNRSANAKSKQLKVSASRGLTTSWSDDDNKRVQFLKADFSKLDLGLGHHTYFQLLEEVIVIIHCDWQVDFNLTISSVEAQVARVRPLLGISTNAPPIGS